MRLPSQFFLSNRLLAVSFLALLYIQQAHHLLWRDELNADPDNQAALEQEGFRIQPLAQFSGAQEIAENLYFYRLKLVPSASPVIGNLPSHSVETSKGAPHA